MEPLPAGRLAAFGGECEDVVDIEALSAAIDATLIVETERGDTGIGTLGGLNCVWRTAVGGSAVRMSAFPLDVVPAATRAAYAEPVCEGYLYDGSGCRVAISNDHTWMLITADAYEWDDNGGAIDGSAGVRLTGVLPLFETALSTAPAPRAAARADDWWPVTSCEELGARLPLEEMLGADGVEPGYPAGFGTDVPYELAKESGATIDCKWHAYPPAGLSAIFVRAYPGGAWDWDGIVGAAATLRPLNDAAVGGATSAVTGVGGWRPESSYLAASDGVNVVVLLEAPDPVGAGELVIHALRDR